jgi:Xaa-Pro aminopeptidase
MSRDEKFIRITQAAYLGDMCFEYILGIIEPGLTEKYVADKIDAYLLSHGATELAFPTICVSGVAGSEPHGVPTEKVIRNGEFLTMDFGGVVGGYCGDMTRTIAIGRPTKEMRHIYEVVLEAQLAGIDKLRSGAKTFDVDKASRDVIAKAGYGEYYIHGTGHGVGKVVHTAPRINTKSKAVLKTGMAVTVEPGIYLPERLGIRIEDLLLITDTGIINVVRSEKALLVV